MSARRRSIADLIGEGPPPGKAGRPVADHRQQLVLAQAEGQKIKNAKMRGELVPAAEVEAAWQAILLDVRAGMLAVPDRVGGRLGDLTPAHLAVIAEEIHSALSALAGQDGRA